MAQGRELMTIGAAAERLGVPRNKVRMMVLDGELKAKAVCSPLEPTRCSVRVYAQGVELLLREKSTALEREGGAGQNERAKSSDEGAVGPSFGLPVDQW